VARFVEEIEARQPRAEEAGHSVSVTGVVFRDDGRVLAIQGCDDGLTARARPKARPERRAANSAS
jgi:hypothetical protein